MRKLSRTLVVALATTLAAVALVTGASATGALASVTGTSPHLATAARFLPADTTAAYFSDWEAIRADMSGVWPGEQVVGDMGFIRALAGRHAPATSTGTAGNGNPWLVHEQWGWSLLDLAWELETNTGLVVVGFSPEFDPAALLSYLSQRDYREESYRGDTVNSRDFSVALPWLRPPFAAFQNLAYLGAERVLVAATKPELVHAALDAYTGRSRSWLGPDPEASPIVTALSDAASSVIVVEATACYGLDPDPAVRSYELAGLGYAPSGAHSTGTVVLTYQGPELAAADLDARARLAMHGTDRSGRRFADGMFSVSAAEGAGSSVVLRLTGMEPAGRLFSLLYSGGAEFLACEA